GRCRGWAVCPRQVSPRVGRQGRGPGAAGERPERFGSDSSGVRSRTGNGLRGLQGSNSLTPARRGALLRLTAGGSVLAILAAIAPAECGGDPPSTDSTTGDWTLRPVVEWLAATAKPS